MSKISDLKLLCSITGLLLLLTSCGQVLPVSSLSQSTDLDQTDQPTGLFQENTGEYAPVHIPFTDFNTLHFQIELFFDPYQQQGEFHINQDLILKLPEAEMPVKTLEVAEKNLIVFTRQLFTSEIKSYFLDFDLGWHEIPLPKENSSYLFRQAFEYHQQVYFILFDMQHTENRMFRLKMVDGKYNLDAQFSNTLPIVALYKQQPHILTVEIDDNIILASGSSMITISETDGVVTLSPLNLEEKYGILELAADDTMVYSLVQNKDYSITDDISQLFRIYDVINQDFISFDFSAEVPFNLRVEDGKPVVSLVKSQKDLADLFVFDIQHLTASGMMSAGINNYEGEVVWSQSYYLQGFIDLLTNSLDDGYNHALDELKTDIRTRLDFEIVLLDQLLSSESGLACRAFTTDRSLAVHAVQSG